MRIIAMFDPITALNDAFSTRLFMWHLTPELSRPVAGRRTRASVAQKHVADATTWGRLERIVRRRGMPATHETHGCFRK
jgi:hypothetical protein